MRKLLLRVLVAGSLLATFSPRRVQAAEVRTEVDAEQVGIGQTFSVRLTVVMGDDDPQPTAPELPLRGQAEVLGPSVGSQRRMIMRNFDVRTETNVVYTWSVTPRAKGRLVLGPPSVRVGSEVLKGQSVTVEVTDEPSPSSRRRLGRRRSPFPPDPFGNSPFGQDPFDQDPFDQDPFDFFRQRSGPPLAPEDLSLAHAADPLAFLHARVDKEHVVLGEPVTLQIFAYGSRGSFREVSPTEPALSDFLSYPSVETSHEQPVMRTTVSGREFLVVKLREMVLVPLKTGDLEIGPMKAVLRGAGRRYPARGSQLGTLAESQPIEVHVTEPPRKGRPLDYQLGDVGRFKLSATLSPKTLTAGDYASLRVEIRGTGNVPAGLHLPKVDSIIWGDPQVSGELEVRDGELKGQRVLSYTPQVTQAGTIEIPALRLPYWDPEGRRYRVAKVELGTLTVEPTGDAKSAAEPHPSTLGSTPGSAPLSPREKLSNSYSAPRAPPPVWAFAGTLGAPALVWLLTLIPALARKLRSGGGQKRRGRRLDLKPIRLAKAQGPTETAKALEREGYELLEERLDLRARGVLKAHLAGELEQRGLDSQLAQELGAFFLRLEEVRYQSGPADLDANALADEGERLLKRLDQARIKGRINDGGARR